MILIPTDNGLHPGIPDHIYHADHDSLSSSGARSLLAKTPAHFEHERRNPRKPKREYDYGHLAHLKVLGEGGEFVVLDPAVHGLTKDRKKVADNPRATTMWKDAEAEARERGATPVHIDDWRKSEAMAEQVRQHPVAGPLLELDGYAELSGYWHDPITGIRLRFRPDKLVELPSGRIVCIDYKGLALDTPIPTPDGWSTMGQLRVGDRVFDSAGQPCNVTAKSQVHLKDCYRITFDDATSIVCDYDHLWATESGTPRQRKVITTAEIARTLFAKSGLRQHRITVAEPLDTAAMMLPVDPYVLGAWLGDGSTAEGKITSKDDEQWDLIEQRGYRVSPPHSTDPDKCPTCTIYGLGSQLRGAGFLGNKHIPDLYLRASVDQRLELLRGLMDTDGSCNPTRHSVIFTSTNKALAESVRELALTLGERAIIHTINGVGFGKPVTCWRVTWNPQRYNPFALTRKADLVNWRPSIRSRQRVITACDRTITVQTQCITVDSPDSTYLCGEQMVPTHNTTIDASVDHFEKASGDYGYFQQEPWYCDGIAACDLDDDPKFLFVVQEKEPPFLVNVIEHHPDDVFRGRDLNRIAINLYADCVAAGEWPGYETVVHTARLRSWDVRRQEHLIETLTAA